MLRVRLLPATTPVRVAERPDDNKRLLYSVLAGVLAICESLELAAKRNKVQAVILKEWTLSSLARITPLEAWPPILMVVDKGTKNLSPTTSLIAALVYGRKRFDEELRYHLDRYGRPWSSQPMR